MTSPSCAMPPLLASTYAPPALEPLSEAEKLLLAQLLARWALDVTDPKELTALTQVRQRLGESVRAWLLEREHGRSDAALPGRVGHLTLSRRPGESVQVGERVWVTVVSVQGELVRLRFEAPVEIPLRRVRRTPKPTVRPLATEGAGDA